MILTGNYYSKPVRQGLHYYSPCVKKHILRVSQANAAADNFPVTDPAGFKTKPEVFFSKQGEKYLFQTGESIKFYELPEGTRVIYSGTVSDGETNQEKIRQMIQGSISNAVNSDSLRDKLRQLKQKTPNPKVVLAFDDVSVPLPPMQRPDARSLILEECEQVCVEEGVTDLTFICAIALHRYVRPAEFRHVCGDKLYDKYYTTGKMYNYNAVDEEFSVNLGKTPHDEDVLMCKEAAESDLCIYVSINYVPMNGGYKSYGTGLSHYRSLYYNHDCKTLKKTTSLYDPPRSSLHKSINRIGKVMQQNVDFFHIESVLDEQLFPFYMEWVLKNDQNWNPVERLLAKSSVFFMNLLPLSLRLWFFWSPLVYGKQGMKMINAGETVAVHEKTLQGRYKNKVIDVQGQSDIYVVAPTCIGAYTKDMYFNPLLVNTYALGYYFNMYVGGNAVMRKGGCVIVVNDMHYEWTSPDHDSYKDFFENVVGPHGDLDEFEKYQDSYATNETFNNIYRNGQGPAGVHGFYMYTWAAHGMDMASKVFVVGATDPRGPNLLGWEMCDTIMEAVEKARAHLKKKDASVTYMRAPPVGYVRVNMDKQEG